MNISEVNKKERRKSRREKKPIWMTWDQNGIDKKIKRKNKSTITISIGTTVKISKRLMFSHGSHNIAVVM